MGLQYGARYGNVERMLLLAPLLFTFGWGMSEKQRIAWKEKGIKPIFHFGFKKELPLRYSFYKDGLVYSTPIPPPSRLLILHGKQDTTVPIRYSHDYATAYPQAVQLVEFESDHQLNDHLDLIWDYVNSFLLA